ncbi:MAG: DUF177 domain-containing protein [Pseudomonadota bacterium]
MSNFPTLESFSGPLRLDRIGDVPETRALVASEEDRRELAAFLDIPGIVALSGEATALRSRKIITVRGHLTARLTRSCVASLEELTEEIDEDFTVTFTDGPVDIPHGEEVEADLDAPEPVEGDKLYLGDVLLEQLVLAMDPHPRKEGVEPIADPKAGERISPFDVLRKLQSES